MFLFKIQRDLCHPKSFGTFEKRAPDHLSIAGLVGPKADFSSTEPAHHVIRWASPADECLGNRGVSAGILPFSLASVKPICCNFADLFH